VPFRPVVLLDTPYWFAKRRKMRNTKCKNKNRISLFSRTFAGNRFPTTTTTNALLLRNTNVAHQIVN